MCVLDALSAPPFSIAHKATEGKRANRGIIQPSSRHKAGTYMTKPFDQPLNIVLLGPPGSGKSTIAEAIVREHHLVVIATGQRLRAEIQSRSALGRAVKHYLDTGDLAPDSLMDRLLR